MKRYLTVLIATLFLCQPVWAEETIDEQEEVETNAFGYPEKSLVKIIENKTQPSLVAVNKKPDCSNKLLVEQAKKALMPHIQNGRQTILDRRNIKLILKNVDNFSLLPTDEINTSAHRRAAGKIVELKINNHLGDENIQVCLSNNPTLSAKLYLVMYDFEDKIKVDIVNFNKEIVPSFIFSEN